MALCLSDRLSNWTISQQGQRAAPRDCERGSGLGASGRRAGVVPAAGEGTSLRGGEKPLFFVCYLPTGVQRATCVDKEGLGRVWSVVLATCSLPFSGLSSREAPEEGGKVRTGGHRTGKTDMRQPSSGLEGRARPRSCRSVRAATDLRTRRVGLQLRCGRECVLVPQLLGTDVSARGKVGGGVIPGGGWPQ